MEMGGVMELSLGMLAVSVAVAAAVLFAALPRIGTPGAMTLFLRYAAVSGVAAVGSSAMYLIDGAGHEGIVSLVLGDVAMVLAPMLLLVALKVLEGQKARRWSLASLALALVMAVTTIALPPSLSLAVKAALLAAACIACALAAVRSPAEPRWPLRLIAGATALYAVYSAARAVVGVATRAESVPHRIGSSVELASVVGAIVVAAIGIAVVRVRLGPRARAVPAVCPAGQAVVVGDWALASAAYGQERMRAMVAELQSAGQEFDESARALPRGVEISMPDAIERLGGRLRDVHGWRPDEVALLVDGAATGAIPTHRPRTGRPSTGNSART